MRRKIVKLRIYTCGRNVMTNTMYFEDSDDGLFLLKNLLWLYTKNGFFIIPYLYDFETASEKAWRGEELFLVMDSCKEIAKQEGGSYD